MSEENKVNAGQVQLTPADFTSKSEPRWCPGCGDYAILAAMKKVLPQLGVPKEKIVFVSGIGCSSRFPYYVDTFGIHSIHGRAPTVASGIKLANPDLKVFVITGDGDGLSIGGNHFIHMCRRNIDLTVVLFNNGIYGLTKGQYAPTSRKGQITKSSPYGTIEDPFNPILMALASGATFVARTIDRNPKHLADTLYRASMHKGVSFVEVYQNCVIFNDGAYSEFFKPDTKEERTVYMEHGKPYVFGKNKDKYLKWVKDHFEVAPYSGENDEGIILHDENSINPTYEFSLASMSLSPDYPTPFGVFRDVEKETYEDLLLDQIKKVKEMKGEGTLEKLWDAGNTFYINED